MISKGFNQKRLINLNNLQILRNFRTSINLKVKSSSKYQQLQHENDQQKQPEKTSLYEYHLKNNGKLVNFAGYLLPVQYSDMGISASHLHTRKFSSIFDVSHMLQTYIRGKNAIECFESICTADIQSLSDGNGTLTVFTSEQGTILDDLIVTRLSSDFLYVVSNAAMKNQDINIMNNAVTSFKNSEKDVNLEFLTPQERALIAVQGPTSVKAIQNLTKNFDLSRLYFMMSCKTNVAGIDDCRITRCGYTGEDGVEISIPADKAVHIVEAIRSVYNTNVKLAGLGARDSLRLEAGLCLYGSDIDATTTPIEAGLAWLVAKRRRQEANFPGAKVINDQLKNGVEKRRIGIRMQNGPPARSGIQIFSMKDNDSNNNNNNNNEKIGYITSGCPSPCLGGNIGMGYVKDEYKKIGTRIELKIRDKFYSGEITKMPFIPSKYYVKPK